MIKENLSHKSSEHSVIDSGAHFHVGLWLNDQLVTTDAREELSRTFVYRYMLMFILKICDRFSEKISSYYYVW